MKPRAKSVPTFESRSFAVQIDGTPGAHKVRILAEPYWRTFLNTAFKVGDTATLYLTSKKPKRTDAQHRYYFVYLSEIAKETGNAVEDLHEFFKAKFLPSKVAEVYGEPVESRASTKTLTRLEFGEYIDRIAELTGVMPPPTDTIRGI